MVLNLGGVGNVTYHRRRRRVIAFDTGPASALLDDFVLRRRGLAYDEDGALAASGSADRALVAAFMDNPFFDRPAPKSLDRQDFHARAQGVEALSDADGAATLAAFTVQVRRRRAAPRAARAGALARHRRRPPERAFHAPACASGSACRVDPVESRRLGRRFPRGAVLRLSRRALRRAACP